MNVPFDDPASSASTWPGRRGANTSARARDRRGPRSLDSSRPTICNSAALEDETVAARRPRRHGQPDSSVGHCRLRRRRPAARRRRGQATAGRLCADLPWPVAAPGLSHYTEARAVDREHGAPERKGARHGERERGRGTDGRRRASVEAQIVRLVVRCVQQSQRERRAQPPAPDSCSQYGAGHRRGRGAGGAGRRARTEAPIGRPSPSAIAVATTSPRPLGRSGRRSLNTQRVDGIGIHHRDLGAPLIGREAGEAGVDDAAERIDVGAGMVPAAPRSARARSSRGCHEGARAREQERARHRVLDDSEVGGKARSLRTSIRMFAGLTSRWARACEASRAPAICSTIESIRGRGAGPSRSISVSRAGAVDVAHGDVEHPTLLARVVADRMLGCSSDAAVRDSRRKRNWDSSSVERVGASTLRATFLPSRSSAR